MTPRNRWIALTLVVLLVANIAWYLYSRWGLITVQVDNRPLAQVIRSIEKQGGVSIRTDIPGETLVTMHVHLVTLREALETLSTVTDSRWRLTYVFGPDKATVAGLLGTVVTGQRPEGWKSLYYPVRLSGLTEANLPADPRKDIWNVKDPEKKTAQGVLDQGARSVSAAFVYPETWDPAVASLPSSGILSKVAPRVAKLTGGAEEEVVLLLRGQQAQADVADLEDDGGFRGGGRNWLSGSRRGGPGGPGNGGDAMAERIRAEIDKLPPEARKAALAEFDERKQFFDSLRNLPPEERRSKIDDFMSQQSVQEQMDQNRLARESRQTPAQKQARAQKYEQRREQYLASGSTGGGGGGGGRKGK